ncbi:hypothetical protein VNO77_44636 [Canavalia gladiata]|uniref:SHSP domain-containing protein n=1 Tax=Canavalia gladiata TaxID=3824 RepID=A0AAN9K016_CANGL
MARSDPKVVDRVYEDFEPSYEWAQDEESVTLNLMLKGFRRENLRVQITTNRILKLGGEQQISDNKWRRFNKEFTIPPNSNTNEIKAKLQGSVLYITLPKIITEVKPETKSPTPPEPPTLETPKEEPKASQVSRKKPQKEKEQPSYQTHEMHETIGGLVKGDENKVEKRLPTTLYGMVVEVGKQKKLANLVVAILLVFVMGMYVKNAIKASFGGSRIQEF